VNDQWYVLAGLILTFLTSLVGWLQSRRNTSRIGDVHVLVNSNLKAMTARVAQLTGALEKAGTEVPPEPGPKA
jgi:hypothetical protein